MKVVLALRWLASPLIYLISKHCLIFFCSVLWGTIACSNSIQFARGLALYNLPYIKPHSKYFCNLFRCASISWFQVVSKWYVLLQRTFGSFRFIFLVLSGTIAYNNSIQYWYNHRPKGLPLCILIYLQPHSQYFFRLF